MSVFASVLLPCVQKLAQISAGLSPNVTKKSCYVCFESEKYAFGVTPRPLGSRAMLTSFYF